MLSLITISSTRRCALWLLCLLAGFGSVLKAGVPPAQCFPLEDLPAEDRVLAEDWLLEVMDKEGLFTLAGQHKPVTLALVPARVSVDNPTQEELARMRQAARILRRWHCGDDLGATLVAGTVVVKGQRVLHGVVFRRTRVAEMVQQWPAVYGAAGIDTAVPAEQVVATTELLPPPLRHRAWGLLLGYPAYAVEFFATADASQRETGNFVPRNFYSVPTFAKATNHFVWAVPKDHEERAEDREIRTRSEPLLERYRALREQMIGEGKPGPLQLLRALLCTEAGCEAVSTRHTR